MASIRLLRVDDEVDFLETLVKRLRTRGLDVRSAKSGGEALEELGKELPDVVILDVKMPDMSGIDVLGVIKKRYPMVEVIMLTGHASLEMAMRGMELGAYDYLMKPMDLDELLYKIEDAHGQKRLREEKQRLEAEG